MRLRVSDLTRLAMKRAPSQAPITAVIEVRMSISQSNCASPKCAANAVNEGTVTITELVAAAMRAV